MASNKNSPPSQKNADNEISDLDKDETEIETEEMSKKYEQLLLESMQVKDPAQPSKEQIWKFWNTQPVPSIDENTNSAGVDGVAIVPDKSKEEIKQVPYKLPEGFEWSSVDVREEKSLEEVYSLLNENYVEDEDAMFRFDYSRPFLRWALMPPGYDMNWHLGVRTKTKKLVAFISGVPATIRFSENSTKRVAEINFLCVHKILRKKRVAPVLIKEITRRINLTGIFQAVYTAGVELPKPITKARYYHRSINIKKLLDCEFTTLGRRQTVNMMKKMYKLPEQTNLPGFRRLQEDDIPQARELLNNYLKQMRISAFLSEDEFKHWLLPRKGVVYSYVVEDPETNAITDFASCYSIPSTVMRNTKYKKINACYGFYNVASEKTGLKNLMHNMLVQAKINNFDVYNMLDCMDNKDFLDDLKFGGGDGELHYYLYNWKIQDIPKEKLGLIML